MPTKRSCGTCNYYEPSPLKGKGWCRNQSLYSPNQNHLVDEGEYSCFRTFGSHWEGKEDEDPEESVPFHTRLGMPPRHPENEEIKPGPNVPPRRGPRSIMGGNPYFATGIIGLVAVVALFFLFRGIFSPGEGAQLAVTPTGTATTQSTATAVAQTTPTVEATPTPSPDQVQIGAKVQVINTAGGGLKMRSSPGTGNSVIRQLTEGAVLDVVGGPAEADGLTWWQVKIEDKSGWCAAEFLALVTKQP